MNKQFAKDVKLGLSETPKNLSSKYFYDEKGSTLFSEIMKLPEYYLTNAEFDIFKNQPLDIIQLLEIHKTSYFELIELGAGDGSKTIELLKVLEHENYHYQYLPIDISQKALDQIENTVAQQLPNKKITPKKGDYFQILNELKNSPFPKVVLFLGSNIGNMEDALANSFLKKLSKNLSKGDKIILGTDLKKEKDIVLPAYNDSKGITRDFNLNLLERINRELDANFDINQFEHVPEYDELEGIAKSRIRSKIDQKIPINSLNLTVSFKEKETIHTEISRKYDDVILEKICTNTGLKTIGKLMDKREYFADYILEKKS
ncbi:L-histidine N(alpha)-methyltransferase [Wenyingzhuangia heitensis]|nr:L-histidine N(alpha)-methyltransferase [Wenyingzhuangia heitensis]